MDVKVFDVEHGACALVQAPNGTIFLIDCGHNASSGWTPARYLRNTLGRTHVDHLIITNTDQDHYSNLKKLLEEISVGVFYFNPWVPAWLFEVLKSQTGPLSSDALAYKGLLESHNIPLVPGDAMSGVSVDRFWNQWPAVTDFNDLSIATFVSFGDFRILFPGDLEEKGWRGLLNDPLFRSRWIGTNILVASHHGRQSGYCGDLFDLHRPDAIVISDKPIMHATQNTVPQYQNCVAREGVHVVGSATRRRVLTTRRDGCIHFEVSAAGDYFVRTYR